MRGREWIRRVGDLLLGHPYDPVLGQLDADEYAVYSVVLDNIEQIMRGCLCSGYEAIAIQDETSGWVAVKLLELALDGPDEVVRRVPTELLDEFRGRNKGRYLLKNLFDTKRKCMLLSRREVREAKESSVFHATHSTQGILQLSRVGFNDARDQALIYVENYIHGLAAMYRCVLLAKAEGAWTIGNMILLGRS